MPRDVQITIVSSLRGRCRFVESLKSITLNIFIENERIHLYLCIIVEQDSIAPLKILYETLDISFKSHKLVIKYRKYSLANSVHDRIYARNNFTIFTVVNLIGRVRTMSPLEIESTMVINIVCLS